MKYYLKSKLKILSLRILQALLFLLPLSIMVIVYRDTFFVEKTGYGITGLGLLGIIIYILSLKHVLGKLPKILYFIILFVLFLSMSYLADFLVQIGGCMLIGAFISLPLNYIIEAITIDGEVDIKERSKINAKKRMKKETIEVEVE